MATLKSLRLAGWKSIADATIDFRPLNLMIGANGAGKSNLIDFFNFVNRMSEGYLKEEVDKQAGANSLMHMGLKGTRSIDASISFGDRDGIYKYEASLEPSVSNNLVITREVFFAPPDDSNGLKSVNFISTIRSEKTKSIFSERSDPKILLPAPVVLILVDTLKRLLESCKAYHFHDTSTTSLMRRESEVNANRSLDADAGNLPAMLYLYRERFPVAYRRIVSSVRAMAPFFDDFVLEPLRLNPRNIELRWRAKGAEYDFGPHQLSDGTLRMIALATLLHQPKEDLPALILLDEPELGLHPAALHILADMMKLAAENCQLLVATQSAQLINHFAPEDVIVVNQRDGASTFERLDADRLKDWLDDYTLGELWERNVIGGGPY